MELITWLLNRFRQYRELKEQVTRLNDRLWEKERKIDDLLTQLESLRDFVLGVRVRALPCARGHSIALSLLNPAHINNSPS